MPREFAAAVLALAVLAAVFPAFAGDNEDCEARNEKSIAACSRIIKRGPENAELAVIYYRRGMNYRDDNKYDQAIADFSRAIRLRPDWSWPLVARGHAYAWSKRYDQGIADQEAAVRMDPSAVTCSARGMDLMLAGEHERALVDLNKSIELDPNRFYAWRTRGDLHMKLNRPRDAVSDYQKALEIGSSLQNENEDCRKGIKAAKAKLGEVG